MGLRDMLGGRKKDDKPENESRPERSGRGSRQCMYGHAVPRGKKMCEHRHWVG